MSNPEGQLQGADKARRDQEAVAAVPVGIPVFVDLTSLVADIIYNLGHGF